MNWEERLVEIRRLLERDPTVQKRWVWECREKVLEFLIARYGAGPSVRHPSLLGSDVWTPPTAPLPHEKTEPPPGHEIRRFLQDIARLNRANVKTRELTLRVPEMWPPNGN